MGVSTSVTNTEVDTNSTSLVVTVTGKVVAIREISRGCAVTTQVAEVASNAKVIKTKPVSGKDTYPCPAGIGRVQKRGIKERTQFLLINDFT